MSVKNLVFKHSRWILLILLLVGISLISRALAVGIKVEAMRSYFSSFGIFAPIFYIFVFALDETVPGGSSVNSILFYVAGIIFRPELAVIYTLTADTFGVTINFLLARQFGASVLKRILNRGQVNRVEDFTKTINWELISLFRLIPFVSTLGVDIISYAAGLSTISLGKFILATLIPWALIDTIQFYSINHFVFSSNALFLLPVYLILTIPLSILILKKRPQYRRYFKNFYSQISLLEKIRTIIKQLFKSNHSE